MTSAIIEPIKENITLNERFDANKLKTIIKNYDSLVKRAIIDDYGLSLMKDYLIKSRNGKIKVNYHQPSGKGRLCAKKSLSLQMISRQIRHTISRDYYIDIDVVNAHPVYLFNLCKLNNIDCPNLKKYIENRDNILKDTGLEREKAKKLFLMMTNSENIDIEYNNTFMLNYHNEINKIHNKISEIYKEQFEEETEKRISDGKTENHKGSFMNKILCIMENNILLDMYNYFGTPNDCVLCFDGIMLNNKETYDINGCIKYIKDKYNIDYFELKQKPMDEYIDFKKLNIEIKEHVYNQYNYYHDFEINRGKEVYEDHLIEWIKNTIVPVNNKGKLIYLLKYPKEYKMCRSNDFEKTMFQFKCRVINDKYDYKYHQQNPKEKSELTIRYLYLNLGFSPSLRGYFSKIMDNAMLKTYYDIDYYPYLAKNYNKIKKDFNDEYTFNLFNEFPHDRNYLDADTNIFIKSRWYNHLKNDFCNGDIGEFNNLLDTFADIIQDPAHIKGIAHLFYGPQGVGKGLLVTPFLTGLIGESNIKVFNHSDYYFENRFNADSVNKIIKVFEEVSEKGQAFKNHNRLKAEITMTTERVEQKGIDGFEVRNCARHIYNTNNKYALYVEGDDRRNTCHSISKEHAQNSDYFDPIVEELENNEFIRSAFKFFAEREYKIRNVREFYDTEYKQNQKLVNLCNTTKFIIEFIEFKYDKLEDKDKRISSQILRQKYKDWCYDNGIKYQLNTFHTQLEKLDINKPKKFKINKKIQACYIINPTTIRNKLRSNLKMPEFNFDFEIIDNSDDDDENSETDFFLDQL